MHARRELLLLFNVEVSSGCWTASNPGVLLHSPLTEAIIYPFTLTLSYPVVLGRQSGREVTHHEFFLRSRPCPPYYVVIHPILHIGHLA